MFSREFKLLLTVLKRGSATVAEVGIRTESGFPPSPNQKDDLKTSRPQTPRLSPSTLPLVCLHQICCRESRYELKQSRVEEVQLSVRPRLSYVGLQLGSGERPDDRVPLFFKTPQGERMEVCTKPLICDLFFCTNSH